MKKKIELCKRSLALILAVVMLPFADYGQALAYSGQNHAPELNEQNEQESLISGNGINEQPVIETQENNSQEADESEKEKTEEAETDALADEQIISVTAEEGASWERISLEEALRIMQTESTDYADVTIDKEAYVLEEDMEAGNLFINGESLDLNGHTLTVYGSVLQTAGEVRLNGGRLIVGEDYRIQTREAKENPNSEEEPYLYKESSGQLVMEKETDYLFLCGSFFMDSTVSHEGKLTAGTMEIMGDFTQLSSGNTRNFAATQEHKIIFCGTKKQEISFQSSSMEESRIANMEIGFKEKINENDKANEETENQQLPQISFQGRPYVAGEVIDTGSHQMSGQIGISASTSISNGYFGGGIYTLQSIQIKPDEKISLGGDADIVQPLSVYGILEIKGNVLISSAIVSMEGGRLLAEGNLTVRNNYNSGIKMSHADDYVFVGGNFTYHPIWEQELSAGTLEIKGDAVINSSFHARGTHKTILSGDGRQTVTMADGMCFHILELTNQSPEGIYSQKPLLKSQLIRNGCKLIYGAMEGSYGYTLEKDEVVAGDFILLDDTLDLNGHSMRIKGDLIQASGTIVINGGFLTVEGDYRQQSMEENQENSSKGQQSGQQSTETAATMENSYGVSTGILQMEKETDYVLINGSMYVETAADTTGKLTEGVLEVKGDFVQKKTYQSNNFKPSDNHTLLLTGTGRQAVSMEYSAVENSRIANLEIQNKSLEGIVFENRPYVSGTIIDSRNKVSGQIAIGSNTKFGEGHFGGSVCTLQEISIKNGEEIEIEGDMEGNQGISIYGSLIVRGSMEVGMVWNAGGITMEGGSLKVGKDLTAGGGYYSHGIRMTHEADHVLVEGNFLYRPHNSEELSAGILELKGNADIQSNFYATGTHRTLLSGERKQTITMAEGLYFNILELQNYSEDGVYSEKALQKSSLIRNGCKLSYGTTEGEYGETLEEDKVVEGNYILLDDTLDLNGYSLTVKGDFIQPAGEVHINGGTLIIEGDYRQQSASVAEGSQNYGASTGLLCMDKEADHVLVKGSMYVQTTANTSGKLTSGVLEIKGDFIQKKTSALLNFNPSGSHTLLLSGEGKQTVSMEYSAVGSSHIENLAIKNASTEGVVFENTPYVAGKIKDKRGQKTSGKIGISGTTIFHDGYFGGSVCAMQQLTVKDGEELEILGDMESNHGISIYGSLTVRGNMGIGMVWNAGRI
ncbi:MAG: hypothetical protein NC412_08125, partial [Roseburia sp.]|nr:hypothetical protein [Roseburia sp.]